MKAVVYSDCGGPEVLRVAEVDTPTPAANELLVRVHAAAVNPADWHLSRGMPYPIRFGRGLRKPGAVQRFGLEYSGTVAAVGRSVTQFAVGDSVFGGREGALAEYVVVPATSPAKRPGSVTFEQAAGVAVAGTTALQGLRDKAGTGPGTKLLINGASGGIGTFAVQLGKCFGAEVTGVQSTRNLDLVRSLGADHVIDYEIDDFTTGSERYDVVLDNVCNRPLSDVRRVLKPGGVYLPNSGGSPERNASILRIAGLLAISPFLSHKIRFFVASPNQRDLQTLADLMRDGRITPVVDTCYPLSDAAAALQHLETGHARGKIVVTVNG